MKDYEDKLLEAYLLFVFGRELQAREFVGKFLQNKHLREESAFIDGIAGLITLIEDETFSQKVESFLTTPSVIQTDFFAVILRFLKNGVKPTKVFSLQTLKFFEPADSLNERLFVLNKILVAHIIESLALESYKCPHCEFLIPRFVFKGQEPVHCISCHLKLLYNQDNDELISFDRLMNILENERVKNQSSDVITKSREIDSEKDLDPEELAKLGFRAFKEGKIEKALQLIDQALKLDRENANILGMGVKIYRDARDTEGMLECLEALEAIDPEDLSILSPLVETYLKLNLQDEAVNRLERILIIDPSNYKAQELLEKLSGANFSDW